MDEDITIKDDNRGKAEFYLATVTDWYPSTREAQIILDGDDSKMTKRYKTACGAVTVNSRVVVMKQSGTYVILGMLDAESSNAVEITTNSSDIFSSIASGFTVSNPMFAKYGKVAMFTTIIRASAAGDTTGWKTWATLKSGKRPCVTVLGNCQSTNFCEFGTDGTIKMAFKEIADFNYRISATYILA